MSKKRRTVVVDAFVTFQVGRSLKARIVRLKHLKWSELLRK